MACFTLLSNDAFRYTNVCVNRCLFLWQSRLKLWGEWSRMGGDLCNENKTHVTFATRHWRWQKGCSLFGDRRGKKSDQIITYNEDWRRSYTTHTFCISSYAFYIRKGSDLLSSAGFVVWNRSQLNTQSTFFAIQKRQRCPSYSWRKMKCPVVFDNRPIGRREHFARCIQVKDELSV